jgi:hypothetical protein
LVLWPYVGLQYQPLMIDECGAVSGMLIGRGKPKCSEKNQPHHKSHMAYTEIGPKPPWWKADDRSQGAALAAFNISYMFRHQGQNHFSTCNSNLEFTVDVDTPRLNDSCGSHGSDY